MVRLSRRFRFLTFGHWPDPRSLATTRGVSVDVLSSGYLDVSVHRVRFPYLCIQYGMTHKWAGFPHSEIPGSKVALTSPGLIAECHVLHRLCAPRHPPNALITLDRIFPSCTVSRPNNKTKASRSNKIKKPGPAVLSRPAHRKSHDGLLVKTLHEYLAFTINMTSYAPGWRYASHVTDLFTMTKTAKGKNKYQFTITYAEYREHPARRIRPSGGLLISKGSTGAFCGATPRR